MDKIKRFTFRLPAELFEKIEKIAQENYRSVNAEVIVAIETYLKSLALSQNSNQNQSMNT